MSDGGDMRMRLATGLAGGLLLLTGCSGVADPGVGALSPSVSAPTSETAGPTPDSTRAPGPEGLDVTALVGNWFVTGKDAEPGLTVTVAPDEFRVWQKCGAAFAPWRASPSGLFAASVSGWSGSCDTRPDLPWLLTATRWQPDGAAVVLLDASLTEVGRLTPGATPTADENTTPDFATPPPVTDDVRRALNTEPTLGADITSGSVPGMLLGSWVALRPTGEPFSGARAPGFTLNTDGTWSGSDGCNGSGGRWSSDGMSRIVASVGGSTLIGCDGAFAPGWLASARLAAFDGAVLVLVGSDGKELGRLTRA